VTALIAASAALLAAASYLSALFLSLMTMSRSAIEEALEAEGAGARAEWLFDHVAQAQLALSLLRTGCRLGFFVAILIATGEIGAAKEISYGRIALVGLASLFVLWIFSTVLASAIARHAPVGIVRSSMPLLRIVTLVFLPLTQSLSFVDEAVRRLTGADLEPEDEAEARLLRSIDDTQREGGLDQRSAAILENVVEFRSMDVGAAMTPRTDIESIELTDDLAAIRAFLESCGHTRIPVYEGNIDHVAGILHLKDLVPYLGAEAPAFALRPLLREPIVVPMTKPVRELLAEFQRSGVHIAIVIDEYGGTAGLITMEDVLEEIVGDIHDEHEPGGEDRPQIREIDERRAEVDGRIHISDVNERLGLSLPEGEDFDTIAGFMLASLGHVPKVGESLEAAGARFTAIAATPTHVQRIGVERLRAAAPGGDP
jgi:CBS domain containing-hemolysin-like protein